MKSKRGTRMSSVCGWIVISSSLALAGCATVVDTQLMEKREALRLVRALPASAEKRISLKLMKHPDTKFRIDNHGYPAWTWRGNDDIGACVHINPKTLKPYLETQFARSDRNATPKYIDFGVDGHEWMCRTHIQGFGIDYESNWASSQCHRDGKRLVDRLKRALY